MIYPSNTDYLFAVQNPSSAFLSEDLKKCTVESRVNKQPLSWNGSFAIIYHLINCYEEFAVKCFTKNVEDIKKRYIALDKLFNNNVIDFLVKTEYKNKGIRVNKKDYEIIKMDWVKGKTLDRFILENIDNNYVIKKLMDNFINVIKQMENLGIAHGDLQHGNILVTENCEIKLVDYDAMFIPEKYSSEHLRTKEIGHPNYQHPKRIDISSYDEKIDRFSAILIYMTLYSIYIYNRNSEQNKSVNKNLPVSKTQTPHVNNRQTNKNERYKYSKILTLTGTILGLIAFGIISNSTQIGNNNNIGAISIVMFFLFVIFSGLIGFIVDSSVAYPYNKFNKQKKKTSNTGSVNKQFPKHIWYKYNNKENLLFTKTDFLNPGNSNLFRELISYNDLLNPLKNFSEICQIEINKIPTLEEFIKSFNTNEIKIEIQNNCITEFNPSL